MANVCCTCASIISHPILNEKTEKHVENKRHDCCGRLVCAHCIAQNPRFAAYCAFCQTPASLELPDQAPPSYSDAPASRPLLEPPGPHQPLKGQELDDPPPYEAEVSGEHPEDVLHHLSPDDTITSLSLAYRVPVHVLRQHNSIWSDHLLSARKVILIPGQFYQGPSLAPDPVEDKEETERKAKIRRLMTRCKIHEYDVAVLYLQQEAWNFARAAERYEADEQWERDHPMKGKQKASHSRSIARKLAVRS